MNYTEKPLLLLIVIMLTLSVCSLVPDGSDYLISLEAWHMWHTWFACAIIAVTGTTCSLLAMTGRLRVRLTLVVLLTAASCLLLGIVIARLAIAHPSHRKLHRVA